jgi:hypothetical protein
MPACTLFQEAMNAELQVAKIRYNQTGKLKSRMTETTDITPARAHALIVPREHGAWGLLFVPLFTGLVAGFAPAYRVWPLLLFTVTSLFLFWLRTPVESLLGTGVIAAHTRGERRVALLGAVILTAVSAACLAALLWGGRNSQLIHIGLIAAMALAAQSALRKLGRAWRMASQLMGAVALTATAPAAYYLGTGHLGDRALILWIANWIFACDQVHFVQLRIHAARANDFGEKFAAGKSFFLAQAMLAATLVLAALWRIVPALVIVAFVPALVRGTRWFFAGQQPLNVRSLGWSEMKQGIAFGVLLAVAMAAPW